MPEKTTKKKVKTKTKTIQKQGVEKPKKAKNDKTTAKEADNKAKKPDVRSKTPGLVDSRNVDGLSVPDLPRKRPQRATPKKTDPGTGRNKGGRPKGSRDRVPRKPGSGAHKQQEQDTFPADHDSLSPEAAAEIVAGAFANTAQVLCNTVLPPPLKDQEVEALRQAWAPVMQMYKDSMVASPWTPALAVTAMVFVPRLVPVVAKGYKRLRGRE